jgi:hypothetical protein
LSSGQQQGPYAPRDMVADRLDKVRLSETNVAYVGTKVRRKSCSLHAGSGLARANSNSPIECGFTSVAARIAAGSTAKEQVTVAAWHRALLVSRACWLNGTT